ncbi:MAG: SusD/RagB family nutrient-binding outer membrane lipoprotein [Rikenellaceae bacterium]
MAYVSSVMSKFDAANDEVKYEMIITQKYIHNFAHFDQEALNEYRRTELPKMLVLPGEQTGYKYTIKVEQDNGEIKSEERIFKFITSDGSTKIMQRMLYPVTESTFNRANLNAAIASMGGDDQKIPLYYSKTYKKK